MDFVQILVLKVLLQQGENHILSSCWSLSFSSEQPRARSLSSESLLALFLSVGLLVG